MLETCWNLILNFPTSKNVDNITFLMILLECWKVFTKLTNINKKKKKNNNIILIYFIFYFCITHNLLNKLQLSNILKEKPDISTIVDVGKLLEFVGMLERLKKKEF